MAARWATARREGARGAWRARVAISLGLVVLCQARRLGARDIGSLEALERSASEVVQDDEHGADGPVIREVVGADTLECEVRSVDHHAR